MTQREISYVEIDKIKLDPNNPRINFIHERFENPDDPQIELELNDNTKKYNDLRNSILTFGGIFNPIVLSKKNKGEYICVEGNTRLSLFREFSESTKLLVVLRLKLFIIRLVPVPLHVEEAFLFLFLDCLFCLEE